MQTVIGLFENAHDAQRASQQLLSNGFTSENVDVSFKGNDASSGNYTSDDSFTGNTATGISDTSSGLDYGRSGTELDSNTSDGYKDSSTSDSYRDSSTSGGYKDSSNDDSFGGKVSRFFKNLFGDDDDEVNRYSHVANKTGSVVTVHAHSEEEAERAADILDEYGAVDVNERAAEYGYTGSMSGSYTNKTDSDDNDSNDSNTLNVIKEDVQIGKREVETGGVRLRSRIVERPVEENVRLREERVTVERQSVDRPATTADFQNFKEGEIEMTERSEIADVSKEARVVEEVKLSKEVNERTETVRETVRDTEVDVENLSGNDLSRKNKKKGL